MTLQSSPEVHISPQTLLPPALRAWEIYLRDQGRSSNTIKAFMGDLQLLADFLPPDQSIGSVTTRDLNHFLQWLQNGRGVPCSPKSLARRITSVKAFFRWLQKHGRITTDPAEKVLQQSVISPLPEVLTAEEQQKLIQAALGMRQARKPDARPYALLTLLLSTGIKKGECLNLSINHIDLEAPNGPVVFIRYAGSQNRYKERRIDLTADWIESYHEYMAQYTPRDQVFPWSPRRLEYLLEDLGTEAGLVKHVSFDMCRWTCALNDYQSGMQPDAIRQKLGISKIQWREIGLKLRKLAGDITES
ncbi:MAG TPA: site-specific integrase [Anaerolineaceae bacterium]|jgi:integrase/recombinase XerD|nr:site-specific integrase [Anaerolineaceae bacterium]HOG78526.1 site-specific integrase [Anaerolineaceae bacterium]HQN43565.1 site-specific integrase [Anaerolineaceae bacterium]